MHDQESIDLTQPPVTAVVTGSQEPTNKPLPTDPSSLDAEKDKKKERKRKRKRSRKIGAQSPETTTANTRNNSEEREEEEKEEAQNRQVRQRRADLTTRKSEASGSILQDGAFSDKMDKSKNQYPSSSGPISNGNTSASNLFFEDVTPAPLPSTTTNLPQSVFDIQVSSSQNSEEAKLLLPAHVSILGSTPVEILPPEELAEEGDTDYIKYLDYGGDRQKAGRIWFPHNPIFNSMTHRSFCDTLKNLRTNR